MAYTRKRAPAPSEPSESDVVPSSSRPGFKRIRRVSTDVWKWEDGVPKFFTVLEAAHKGRALDVETIKGKDKPKGPAIVMQVKDLIGGDTRTVIVAKVLGRLLDETYPKESYVGKSFEAVQLPMKKGGSFSYHPFQLDEIDPNG